MGGTKIDLFGIAHVKVMGCSENLRIVNRKFNIVRIDNFSNFNAYGRRKYARFCESHLKICEMKIQPVS